MNVPDNNGKFYFLCVNCLNERKLPTNVIQEHVLCDGFLTSYTKWIWHSELIDMPSVDMSEAEKDDLEMDDRMEEMIRDIEHDSFQSVNVYENLCNDAEKPLYAECTKYTRLLAVLNIVDINNYTFHTKDEDEKSTTQNSGVMVVAESMHFSSSKDKYLIMASMCYFGVIEDIWIIDYTSFRVPIFKCKWVDSNIGVKIDDLGFTLVDLEKEGYTKEPFIMASQAK